MTMQSQAFFHQPTSTVTYLVWDEASGEAAVIDPVLDYAPASATITTTSADRILRAVSDLGLDVRYVLETHAHADHLSAAEHFRKATGAVVVIGEHIGEVQAHFAPLFEAKDVIPDGSAFGRLVADGDSLELGETRIRVMH
ncbi:MAG: MBL fold metallo-hydrolase, partial [Caulobacteraceae bacterium]|nr:MBL fold metallo-hydrolase [Caulobacteraceae bacterium]